MEMVSEPWAPPPFNLPVVLWILLGRPGSHDSESQPGRGSGGGVPAAARAGDARRFDRAKEARELVRQVILKEMDPLGPAVAARAAFVPMRPALACALHAAGRSAHSAANLNRTNRARRRPCAARRRKPVWPACATRGSGRPVEAADQATGAARSLGHGRSSGGHGQVGPVLHLPYERCQLNAPPSIGPLASDSYWTTVTGNQYTRSGCKRG